MDLTPYVAALRDDLAAAASVGDEATARASTSLAAALEPAVRLTIMNALSDLAAEVSGALPDHSVDVRLHGREVEVVVHGEDSSSGGFSTGPSSSPFPGGPGGPGGSGDPGGSGPGRPGGPPFGSGGPDVGDISRMTLRIVDQIKGQAERAAAAQGMSLNSWVAQAVQGALRGQGGWPGSWGERGGEQGRGWSGGWSGQRWPGHGSSGQGWPGQGWPGHGWSGQGWSEQDRPGQDRPGQDRPDQGGPGDGVRRDESTSGPGGTSGSATPSERPRDRRDDDPGDGGVQGWVRG